jgi:hypothetical protein
MHLTPCARSDDERRPPLANGLLDRVHDQLAILRHRELGRDIGPCARCGTQVRSQQNFIRQDGAIAHLRCRITHPSTRPAAP